MSTKEIWRQNQTYEAGLAKSQPRTQAHFTDANSTSVKWA